MADRYNTPGTGVLATQLPTRNSNDRLFFSDGGDRLDTLASDAAKDFLAVILTAGTSVETAEGAAHLCDIDQSGAGILDFASRSRRWAHGGGSTGVVARVFCRPLGNGELTLGAAACTYGDTYGEAGRIIAGALAVMTNLYMGLSGKIAAAYHATPITLLEAMGNSFTSLRRIATTMRIGDRAAVVLEDQTLAYPTIEMRGGPESVLRPCGGSVSSVFKGLSGTIDARGLKRDWDLSGATVTLGPSLKILNPTGGSNLSSPRIIWPSESSILFKGSKPEGFRV